MATKVLQDFFENFAEIHFKRKADRAAVRGLTVKLAKELTRARKPERGQPPEERPQNDGTVRGEPDMMYG